MRAGPGRFAGPSDEAYLPPGCEALPSRGTLCDRDCLAHGGSGGLADSGEIPAGGGFAGGSTLGELGFALGRAAGAENASGGVARNRARIGYHRGYKGKEVVQLSSDLPERTVTLEVAGR